MKLKDLHPQSLYDRMMENKLLAMRATGLLLAIRETTELPEMIEKQIDELLLELQP